MFHTKICGVVLPDDIDAVADSGADAVGLNFYPPSLRYVDPESDAAKRLAERALERGLLLVGVFVNQTAERIDQLAQALSLQAIQLHGDESPELVAALNDRLGLPVIRAIKLPTGSVSVDQITAKVSPWSHLGCHLLLDSDGGSRHGGTGKCLDWSAVQRWSVAYPRIGWTLAGGLNPDNVGRAIRESGAVSVDTASGVEQPRGRKSAARIHQFVAERQNAANR